MRRGLNKKLKGVNKKPCEYLEEQHLDLQDITKCKTDWFYTKYYSIKLEN